MEALAEFMECLRSEVGSHAFVFVANENPAPYCAYTGLRDRVPTGHGSELNVIDPCCSHVFPQSWFRSNDAGYAPR